MVGFLNVHGPLPNPWLSWAFVWTSCMHEDPIVSCSYPHGQWFSYEHLISCLAVPLLFLSVQSSITTGRAGSVLPPCLSTNIRWLWLPPCLSTNIRWLCGWGSAGIFIAVAVVQYKWVQYVQVQGIMKGERRHTHSSADVIVILRPCYSR